MEVIFTVEIRIQGTQNLDSSNTGFLMAGIIPTIINRLIGSDLKWGQQKSGQSGFQMYFLRTFIDELSKIWTFCMDFGHHSKSELFRNQTKYSKTGLVKYSDPCCTKLVAMLEMKINFDTTILSNSNQTQDLMETGFKTGQFFYCDHFLFLPGFLDFQLLGLGSY